MFIAHFLQPAIAVALTVADDTPDVVRSIVQVAFLVRAKCLASTLKNYSCSLFTGPNFMGPHL